MEDKCIITLHGVLFAEYIQITFHYLKWEKESAKKSRIWTTRSCIRFGGGGKRSPCLPMGRRWGWETSVYNFSTMFSVVFVECILSAMLVDVGTRNG